MSKGGIAILQSYNKANLCPVALGVQTVISLHQSQYELTLTRAHHL